MARQNIFSIKGCSFAALVLASLFTQNVLAQESASETTDDSSSSGWSFSLTTLAASYIERKIETGDDHFASVAGPFDGAKAMTTFNATYTLPTPLGSHWLLSGANVELTGSLELSPVSLRPKLSVDFTPVPFLVFGAGASIGSGWNPLGFDGMSKYNFKKAEYESLTPFAHYYYDYWASATFQFDTGALIEGDWSHVVLVASYKWIYQGITGVDDGEIWEWQVFPGCANGWQYSVTGVLGYQMPLVLNMVGVMGEFYGHYDPADYGKIGKTFDGDFMWIDLSLLLSFKLNETNSLTTLYTVEGERSFATKHEKADEEPLLVKTGREWFFYRIALSWKHLF